MNPFVYISAVLAAALAGLGAYQLVDHAMMQRRLDAAHQETAQARGLLANAEADVTAQKGNVQRLEAAVADQNLRILDLQASAERTSAAAASAARQVLARPLPSADARRSADELNAWFGRGFGQ